MKYLMGVLLAGSTVFATAEFGGTDGSPWKASADIVNSSGHTGIVVTDSTYAQCQTQFQNAMNSHAYYHGDVFTNIKNCSYKPAGVHVLNEVAEALSEDLATLENTYNINQYLAKKKTILKNYQDNTEVLPAPPRRER